MRIRAVIPETAVSFLRHRALRIATHQGADLRRRSPLQPWSAPSSPWAAAWRPRGTALDAPQSNISPSLGVKHELGYTAHWQWTAGAFATLPSGDREFGSPGLGVAANAIVSYSRSGPFGASLMLGVTSETTPSVAGGERYLSINPDFVVTWQSTQRLQFYAEVYGQSHTGHGQGWGSDADGGVQYLITPSFEVDLEEGVRIQGNLGRFSHYTGVGIGLLF